MTSTVYYEQLKCLDFGKLDMITLHSSKSGQPIEIHVKTISVRWPSKVCHNFWDLSALEMLYKMQKLMTTA